MTGRAGREDRIAGALLGVHAGEALGATLEFSRGRPRAVDPLEEPAGAVPARTGGRPGRAAGCPPVLLNNVCTLALEVVKVHTLVAAGAAGSARLPQSPPRQPGTSPATCQAPSFVLRRTLECHDPATVARIVLTEVNLSGDISTRSG